MSNKTVHTPPLIIARVRCEKDHKAPAPRTGAKPSVDHHWLNGLFVLWAKPAPATSEEDSEEGAEREEKPKYTLGKTDEHGYLSPLDATENKPDAADSFKIVPDH